MRHINLLVGSIAAAAVASGLAVATQAYSLTAYKWALSPVLFYANTSNADVSATAAEAALRTGLNAWNGLTTLNFQYGGRVNDTSTSVDGRNVIIFRNATSGSAVATSYNWASGGVRIESDIVFWDATYRLFTGTSGCAYTNSQYGVYIEDIAAHELGHAAGLAHSNVADATMYPTYTACTQSWRTLASDDILGLKSLYSALSGALPNTAPSVSITAPTNGASYVQGASIPFSGTATDAQDGSLTSRITWTSSRDGQIGTGGSFSRTTLSIGSHVITASVTDNGGLSSSAQRTITVASTTSTTTTGWATRDIGAVTAVGSFASANGTFTLKGSGADIFGNADEFRFGYRTLTGDGTVVARVATLNKIVNWTKAGVMMRAALSAESRHASMLVAAGGAVAFRRRVAAGGSTAHSGNSGKAPYWVKLTRNGSTFRGYASPDGSTWTLIGSESIQMPSAIYVGLAVTSGRDGTLATATFDHVTP